MSSPTFDGHRDRDHNKWSYLYYVIYLKSKDRSDFTGVETCAFISPSAVSPTIIRHVLVFILLVKCVDVGNLLDEGDLSWVPLRMSFALKNMRTNDKEDSDKQEGEKNIVTKLANLEAKFDSKLEDLERSLREMSKEKRNSVVGRPEDMEPSGSDQRIGYKALVSKSM